jgi:aromatic-L-amino-acid/L-tryptophan decarboxylase
MDTENFRKYGHEFIDWLADYFENIEKYPVKPNVQPGEMIRQFPVSPPAKGEPMDDIFRDFQTQVVPGITHWQHPGLDGLLPGQQQP